MKKLLGLLFLIVSLSATAQYSPNPGNYGSQFNRLKPIIAAHLPERDSTQPVDTDSTSTIWFDTVHHQLLVARYGNRYGFSGGSVIDTTSLSNRINNCVLIANMPTYLASYLLSSSFDSMATALGYLKAFVQNSQLAHSSIFFQNSFGVNWNSSGVGTLGNNSGFSLDTSLVSTVGRLLDSIYNVKLLIASNTTGSVDSIRHKVIPPLNVTVGFLKYSTVCDCWSFDSTAYQPLLGFTPENVVNKVTTFGTINNTLYPTTQAIYNFLQAQYLPIPATNLYQTLHGNNTFGFVNWLTDISNIPTFNNKSIATSSNFSAVDSVWRKVGTDSIYWRYNGTAFSVLDSAGVSASQRIIDSTNNANALAGKVAYSKYQTDSTAQAAINAGKQAALTLTTTGSSGPATLSGGSLNIPNYAVGSTKAINQPLPTLTKTANYRLLASDQVQDSFTTNSQIFIDSLPASPLDSTIAGIKIKSLGAFTGDTAKIITTDGSIIDNGVTSLSFYVQGEGKTFTYKKATNTWYGISMNLTTNSIILLKDSNNTYTTPTQLATKENIITPINTIKYYWNGYKVFSPFLTDSVPEGSINQYFTVSRARASLSLTTTSVGAATYNSSTGVFNIPTPSTNYWGTAGNTTLSSRDTTSWVGTVNNAYWYWGTDNTKRGYVDTLGTMYIGPPSYHPVTNYSPYSLYVQSGATITGNLYTGGPLIMGGEIFGEGATFTSPIGVLLAEPTGSVAFQVGPSISNNKGSLPFPILTGTQIAAISSPATYLCTQNSTTGFINIYNGTIQTELMAATPGTKSNGMIGIFNTTSNTYVPATITQGAGITVTNAAGSITIAETGATASQTTVSGSTSGSAVFSQPGQGSSSKKVMIYCNALVGTASYTFPTAFVNTPGIVPTYGMGGTIVVSPTTITTLTTTSITITGATTSGFIIIEGY